MWRHRTLAVLVLMLAIWWRDSDGRRSRGRCAKYGPLVDRDISRTNTLSRLIHASDATCIKQLRMSRSVFHKLCTRLKERGLLVDTFHVSVEEQVAIFLYMVGQHHTNASVGFSFWRSGETASMQSCKQWVSLHEISFTLNQRIHTERSLAAQTDSILTLR